MSRKRRLARTDTIIENLISEEEPPSQPGQMNNSKSPKSPKSPKKVKQPQTPKPIRNDLPQQTNGPEGEPLAKAGRHMPSLAPGLEKGYVQLGREPRRMMCPVCGADVITRVQWKPSLSTHVIALLLCLFVLWPCVCIPYCTPACLDIIHYCPNCNSIIGTGK